MTHRARLAAAQRRARRVRAGRRADRRAPRSRLDTMGRAADDAEPPDGRAGLGPPARPAAGAGVHAGRADAVGDAAGLDARAVPAAGRVDRRPVRRSRRRRSSPAATSRRPATTRDRGLSAAGTGRRSVNLVDYRRAGVHAVRRWSIRLTILTRPSRSTPCLSSPHRSQPTHEVGGTTFTSLATPSLGSRAHQRLAGRDPGGRAADAARADRRGDLRRARGRGAGRRSTATTSTAGAGDAIVVPPGVPFALANAGPEDAAAALLPAGRRAGACCPAASRSPRPGRCDASRRLRRPHRCRRRTRRCRWPGCSRWPTGTWWWRCTSGWWPAAGVTSGRTTATCCSPAATGRRPPASSPRCSASASRRRPSSSRHGRGRRCCGGPRRARTRGPSSSRSRRAGDGCSRSWRRSTPSWRPEWADAVGAADGGGGPRRAGRAC